MGKLFGPQDELAEQKSKILIEQINPFSGSMDLHELVRRVREGDSAKWQTTSQDMAGVASGNEQAANAGQEMLQALESSWSGEGADAASQAIRSSITVTQDASDVYQRNSDHFTTNSGQFEDIKHRLPDVPAKPPETGAWDTITPWDTDAEDAANKYKADVDAARSMYSGYEGNVHRSAYDMQADFGQIKDLGGDFGAMERDRSGSVEDSGSGVIDIPGSDGGGDTSRSGTYDGSVGGSDRGGTSVPPGGGYQPPNPSNVPTSPAPTNDHTGTSGYTPPSTVTPPAANYPGPNGPGGMPGGNGFGPNGNTPGTTGFGNTGFGPTGTPGAGPGGSSGGGAGGGRFSPPGMGRAGGYSAGAGGGAGGYSSGAAGGGAPGSGGGAPGAGRMTGSAPGGFGPTGSGATAAGGAGAAAAGGRGGGMPMGAMGGAGRGGQGGEDEEHQRKYLADSDEAFSLTEDGEVLRDPVTGHVVTPPTIGE
ncbi:hypothetical protein FHS23_000258 [Prauserella isguenensis]|uniref:PPE family domain-containing protein n=1 Tax=Prauserella isguenensis TaxID=1470180 RepID=A0A839RVU5_9PSEU|nr:hypothetical protein [Prauserella isguenensis]MBB3049263.1 hypothetical protein [Prauserella isguenensis]